MSENQKKILEMLADKKISDDEAYRLLSARKTETGAPESPAGGAGHQHDEGAELVNVRVPMSLIRSGMKFTSLLPAGARDKVTEALGEKGINLDMRNMKPEDLEEIIEALSDLEVKVVSDKEIVKVFVE